MICPLTWTFSTPTVGPSHYSWSLTGLFVAIGIASFLGQSFNNIAYSYEKAAKVASVQYLEIIYGFIFSTVLFEVPIKPSDILAAGLIVSCTLIMSLLSCCRKQS